MSIRTVRDGLKARLQTISGLRVYDVAEGPISTPAALIVPDDINFHESMASGGRVMVRFNIHLYVQATSLRSAQDAMDDLWLSSGGDVRDAIEADKTLGGAADSCVVETASGYGLEDGLLTSTVTVRVVTTKD